MGKLAEKRTLSCGTVNSNRVGLPADMKKACTSVKRLKRGESLKRMKGRILAVTWKDTRIVNLLCNVPGVLGDDTVRRREKRDATEVTISRPEAIALYNTFMGGVDLSDQRVSTYRRHIKSLTWYSSTSSIFLHCKPSCWVENCTLPENSHRSSSCRSSSTVSLADVRTWRGVVVHQVCSQLMTFGLTDSSSMLRWSTKPNPSVLCTIVGWTHSLPVAYAKCACALTHAFTAIIIWWTMGMTIQRKLQLLLLGSENANCVTTFVDVECVDMDNIQWLMGNINLFCCGVYCSWQTLYLINYGMLQCCGIF